ncbi:MAG: NADP-dependent succinate-semialdehyde dehydrogenase [Proteobacteria bacterium]|nr:NADP-dependent succinate-semialdehyde dehydrogenase [Pseudomonadota bacterium]
MNLSNPSLFCEQCYIDGTWVDADDGSRIEIDNPADGTIIGSVPRMGAAETRRAIQAASAAFPKWRALTAKERAGILRNLFELILENQEDLAVLMTTEQGKPLVESRAEVGYGASFVEWFAEEGKRIYGDTIPGHQQDKRIVVIKEPVGVVASITPWNFPLAMLTRKVAPALAAGCTVIAKPASQTPHTALALARLAEQAGIPEGVLNVLCGISSEIGGEITSNPAVRKLSFTGSAEVGKRLTEQCAETMKKVTMELGGNAPFIVFDDADIESAVEGAIQSKFRNAGQTCVCANRIFVQDGVYDHFNEKLAAAVSALNVGNGLDEATEIGPLIDQHAIEKVEHHVQDASTKGARVLTGGQRHTLGGNFYSPTVLADATADMALSREETFGPLAPVYRFKTGEDAIRMANDTEYGLAAYFYTRDITRVWKVAEALEYGIVGINTGLISTEVAPFGGMKESGIGREGSKYGIEEYLEIKYLCMGGIT